ncbi:hypothetical protein CVU37_02500 [candidate division BRC1 bacterium HGW-BRC1-1]|jgi:hypothetical protein|nr:MAG: hypothetical protein CVU37_02500 [candidate division BRC1 bacterium HGW-BRC1-1]
MNRTHHLPRFAALAACLLLPFTALAHSGHDQNDGHSHDSPAAKVAKFHLDAPVPPAASPLTHDKFQNDPANFQFVVMSDRTGGARAGIFESAIEKINMLHPEFVISVGDLIGGYTTDTEKLTQEWDEVDKMISDLDSPYFYVPGNHDLSNPTEVDVYTKRRGRPYYHFLYKDALFLVVNSEDPYPARVSDDQIAYFKKVLEDNPDPRWTFVFMHEPLWRIEETEAAWKDNGGTQWEKMDALLKPRKYTLFAGHTHAYAHTVRNGNHEHIVLATTGGGSKLRGARTYGEFDHIVWVTMDDNGPDIANLALDGILPRDVRTEATQADVSGMSNSALKSVVIRADHDTFTSATTEFVLKNATPDPIRMKVEFVEAPPLRVDPALVTRDLASQESTTISLSISAPGGVAPEEITAPIMAKWSAIWSPKGTEPLELTGTANIGIIRDMHVKHALAAVTVDGNLQEWTDMPLMAKTAEPPSTRWTGVADASFRAGLSYDNEYLYIAMQTRDDKTILDATRYPWEQDGVEVRIDARPDPARSHGRAASDFIDHLIISIAPPATAGDKPVIFQPDKLPAGTKYTAVANDEGIAMEAAIPVAWLNAQQKADWKAVRVNFTQHDHDTTEPGNSTHLFWRPDWRDERNVEGSGTFLKH